jgi:hypothetical protein
MRWYDSNYSKRFPIVLDGSATAAGVVDAQIALTGTAAEFWATVQADVDDIRIARADGLAGISYDLESRSYANKTVTIELDGLTHHVTNTMTVVWAYFGDADAVNGEDGFTTSSPLTGYTLFTGPGDEPVYALGTPVGATAPVNRRQKRTTETIYVWFAVGPFGDLAYPFEGRGDAPEGPQSLSSTATVLPGGAGTVTAATSSIRLYQDATGAVFARITASGGTTANSYDLVLTVVTTEGRTLNGVVRIDVQD